MATVDTHPQVVLRRRPVGLLHRDDVELIDSPVPDIAEGEALVDTHFIGCDATVRSWLNPGPGYLPPVGIGEVVRAATLGRVIASRCPARPVGHWVTGLTGWQRYGVVRDDFFSTDYGADDLDPRAVMALHGSTGATAWFGLMEVGTPREGETVVVSAAAGATGSIVGQVARAQGCRVVGIAGTPDKCAVAVEEFGFDACIAHRTEDVAARLAQECPRGVDIYFDNVGGPILDTVLGRLAPRARVVLCGAISVYNADSRPPGPSNYLELIPKRARMEGFLALDYVPRFPEAFAALAELQEQGRLHYRAEQFDGLDHAVDALNSLFTGANIGKVMIALPAALESP